MSVKNREPKKSLERFTRRVLEIGGITTILFSGGTPVSAEAENPVNTHCSPGETPSFVLGFAELNRLIGGKMGTPKECEHGNPDNGDTLQLTDSGLAFWRKSTNTTTWTNGDVHYANVPGTGLVEWRGAEIDPPGLVASPPRVEPQAGAPETAYQENVYAKSGNRETLFVEYSYPAQKYDIRLIPTDPAKEKEFNDKYKAQNGKPTHLQFVGKEHPAIKNGINGKKPYLYVGGAVGSITEIPMFNVLIDDQPSLTKVYLNPVEESFTDFYLIRFNTSNYSLHFALGGFATAGLRGMPFAEDAKSGKYFTLQWKPAGAGPDQNIRMDQIPEIVKKMFPQN